MRWWGSWLVIWVVILVGGCNAFDDPPEDFPLGDPGRPDRGPNPVSGGAASCSSFECTPNCPFGCGAVMTPPTGGTFAPTPAGVPCGTTVCEDPLALMGLPLPTRPCCAEPGVCGTIAGDGSCQVVLIDERCPEALGNLFGIEFAPCCVEGMCGLSLAGTMCVELDEARDMLATLGAPLPLGIPAARACGLEDDGGVDDADSGLALEPGLE